MSSYIQEQEKEDIQIVDIYWDRIYLHIKIEGDESIYSKKYAIATRKEKYLYPILLNRETNEFVINITNVQNQEMLCNGNWFIKYYNENYIFEMEIYEKELKEYEEKYHILMKKTEDDEAESDKEDFENNDEDDENLEKPWIPYEWKDIPVTMEVCKKFQNLDKIYKYSGNNYAYTVCFAVMKTREELLCVIRSEFMVKNTKPEKRWFKIESKKISKRMKKRLIYALEQFLNIVYQCVSHLTPKTGKKILIMSETRDMGGNLKALDDRIKERGLEKEFKISYHFAKTLEMNRSKIFFVWLKLAFLTACQDFIFVDDYVPFFKYISVHPKTKLIQVWHAGVGFKSVGYARFGQKGSPYPLAAAHRKYDYAIVGGEALRDVYAEVFGIDREQCLPYGLMRIDGYMDETKISGFKKKFYEAHAELKGKKIILFAPTFRGNGQRTAFYPYEVLEQDKIYEMCGEEYVFLIKMHPFVSEKIKISPCYQDRIVDFSDFPDINSLFYVTDILITDYSSNIYEFSLQKKPIISFAYDKEEYELIRSVHRTLDKYAPGKVCTTLDEVISTIKNEDFEMERLYKFIEENFDKEYGNACDKVIDNILLSQALH